MDAKTRERGTSNCEKKARRIFFTCWFSTPRPRQFNVDGARGEKKARRSLPALSCWGTGAGRRARGVNMHRAFFSPLPVSASSGLVVFFWRGGLHFNSDTALFFCSRRAAPAAPLGIASVVAHVRRDGKHARANSTTAAHAFFWFPPRRSGLRAWQTSGGTVNTHMRIPRRLLFFFGSRHAARDCERGTRPAGR